MNDWNRYTQELEGILSSFTNEAFGEILFCQIIPGDRVGFLVLMCPRGLIVDLNIAQYVFCGLLLGYSALVLALAKDCCVGAGLLEQS